MFTSRAKVESLKLEGLIHPGPPLKGSVGTYPAIGVMSELIEGVAETLGIDETLVRPEGNSTRTLDLGTTYSPEGACLPFKLILGSLINSLEKGANTVGMITERGPCRLGFYSLGMRLIFSDLELGNGWFDFNNASVRHGYIGAYRQIYRQSFGRNLPLFKLGKAFAMGFVRLMSIEDLEAERNRFLAVELEPGSVMECYEQGRNEIRKAKSPFGIRRALRRARESLHALPVDETRETVKVMITGEVYCVIDPFANANIETRLAQLGAEPIRVLWQTSYLRYAMHLDHFQRHNKRKAVRAARNYLPEQLGGDCNSNIGHALMAHDLGYDGMVHLKPFGCMVEFVAENLLRVVEKDTGFPILCLTLDDLAAEERINVRLEAFVENLFQRKRARSRRS